jgi:hypothetical protein
LTTPLRGIGDRRPAGESIPGVAFKRHDKVSISASRQEGKGGRAESRHTGATGTRASRPRRLTNAEADERRY